jgi:hypothetical protein
VSFNPAIPPQNVSAINALFASTPTNDGSGKAPAYRATTPLEDRDLAEIKKTIDGSGKYPSASINYKGDVYKVTTDRTGSEQGSGTQVDIVGTKSAAYFLKGNSAADRTGTVQVQGMSFQDADRLLSMASAKLRQDAIGEQLGSGGRKPTEPRTGPTQTAPPPSGNEIDVMPKVPAGGIPPQPDQQPQQKFLINNGASSTVKELVTEMRQNAQEVIDNFAQMQQLISAQGGMRIRLP